MKRAQSILPLFSELYADAERWAKLTHTNVLELLRTFQYGDQFCHVFPLPENGSLNHYVQMQPHTDRLQLVSKIGTSLSWALTQSASALESLHTQGVIHGAFDADSILVTQARNVMVAGFTAVKIARPSATYLLSRIRRTSPEVLQGLHERLESDV